MPQESIHQRKPQSLQNSAAEHTPEMAPDLQESIGLLSDNRKKVVHEAGRPRTLLTWDELPSWRQDNHYITAEYRQTSKSYKKSFASLGYLHNETVNIYSHAVGAIFYPFLGLGLYFPLRNRFSTANIGDLLSCGCFFVGAMLCMGMSATYHTIMNHSLKVDQFGNQLDYLGIVFLIAGSFVPNVYYGFYCDKKLQAIYWTMMGTFGLGCAIMSTRHEFRTPQWRPYRASMFVAMGLSSVIAVIHGCVKYGAGQFNRQMEYEWMIYEGLQYTLGAGLYAARIPERFNPGRFNVWGASHQIFHFLVVTAAATHLVGVLKAFDYNHTYVHCS